MAENSRYKIGTLAGVAIVMANMIGTGPFTSLGFQLKEIQSLPVILTLWILGGLLALAGAFSYAEVSTSINRSGGEYTFLSEMYHPIAGYLSGWVSLTAGFAAPIALAAIAFTGYFQFGNLSPKWMAILLIAIVTLVHTRNLHVSSGFQIASTLFKIAVMVSLILCGLLIDGQAGVSFRITDDYYAGIKSSAFAIALIYVTYSYSGWNAAAYISEEFKNPRRSLPVALVVGTVIVTVLYTLLQSVFLKHAPVSELIGQVEVGEIVTSRMFGLPTGRLFGVVISILLVSSISAMVWVGPRVTSSMAGQHKLWQYFKTDTAAVPKRALWLQFTISLLLILTGTFEQIMVSSGVLLTLSTMLVVFAVFLLRFKKGHKSRHAYRSPLFPFLQILYLLLAGWTVTYAVMRHPYESLVGLANLLAGAITYHISSRTGKEKSTAVPVGGIKSVTINSHKHNVIMKKQRGSHLVANSLCLMLSLFSINSKAQEAARRQSGNSHHSFSDKDAVAKMAKNFEPAERDSMQQPHKVVDYLGNIKGRKIMDIGAATGYFSVKFAAKGAFVIAADVSDEFQAFLKERIEKEKIGNIELRKVPYDSPSLKDHEVDIVFIANTYHHIENRTEYFAKVKQGLKSNGELVVLDFFKAEFTHKVQAPAMGMRASVDEVIFELKKAGFTLFEVEVNLLPYQYIIKAK